MRAHHRADGTGTLDAHMFGHERTDELSEPKRGIFMVPGGGGTETSWQQHTATNPNVITKLLYRLIDGHRRRFVTFPTNWEWGNDIMIERVDDAWETAKAECHFASDKVHLILVSMGAGALNWVKDHLDEAASVSLIIPAGLDPQDIHDNGRVVPYGTVVPPSAAFGGARPPDSHTPARHAAAFTPIPVAAWYSNNDSVLPLSVIEPFLDACRGVAHNLGDQFPAGFAIPGHGADNLPLDEIVAWIAAHD